MEFDEIVVKESPGLCRCCLSEGCYKDLGTEYVWMDDTEVYADMLLECFDIGISQHMEGPNGPNRLICEVCITRLRDACNFKKQVLDSEQKFIDMVGRGDFKNKALYQDQLKCEITLEGQPVNTDVEFLDEDVDYDDPPNNDEPTVSEDITVSTLPIKSKRGRPKKTVVKEKKKAKTEEKAKAKVKDERLLNYLAGQDRKYEMKKFVTAIIEYSTILPFRWASNKFMCFYCSSSFELSSLLKQHTEEEHQEVKLTYLLRNMDRLTKVKLDVSRISCKLCPKPVNDLRDFMNHVTEFHDVDVNKGIADSLFSFILDDEDMVCLDCGECFKFFSTLLSHVYKYHAKTHPFLCEACGRGFVDKTNLDNHVKTVHPHFSAKTLAKSKKYKCPKCPEILSSKYFKKQHIVNVHEGICAQFMCDMCPRVFMFKSKLNQHKARTHLKEKSFTCDLCGFKVFSRDLLRMHMVRHDASRPFECEICKKAFQRKKTLEFHRRIHTDDRRYVCKECGRAFVQHTSLKVHLRAHQNERNKE